MPPRLSVFVATSLDGFLARADGSLDWLDVVARPGEDYGYAAFFESIDAVVVGRRTYETALGFASWPYAGKRCFVVTRRPIDARHGEQAIAGSADAIVATLDREGVRRAYVDGGEVIRAMLGAGLVDDLTVSTVPILLGDGVRLFGGAAGDVRLDVAASRAFPSGLVQTEYRVRRR
jgi:dihydrofolate reductase